MSRTSCSWIGFAASALFAFGCGEAPSSPSPVTSGIPAAALSPEAATTASGNSFARARSATARYHDIQAALDDGFVQASPCVAAPDLGAMGFHYIDFARMGPTADVERPQALLYVPEDGELRLVAVEYIVPVLVDGAPYFGPTPPADPGPFPVLFGRSFDGPEAPPGRPWQFTLHAWIWRHNPDGMFAPFNPTLSCAS